MTEAGEIIVVGAGPAGLAAGCALAAAGLSVTVVGPPAPADADREGRTAALFPAALAVLDAMGVLSDVAPVSAAITAIRIVDDMGRLLRAPEVRFDAADMGLAVLARNIPNGPLVRALEGRAASLPTLQRRPETATEVVPDPTGVTVRLTGGACLRAALVVAADGRRSMAREAAGIAVDAWTYPQTAITTAFSHSRPHGGVSTEFHRPAGPFTVIPLPSDRSALVWLESPAEAERLTGLDDAAFRGVVQERLNGLLGAVGAIAPRVGYPMGGLIAAQRGARRIALVGETAHAFPPIGAQGLNLTLRDIAELTRLVAAAQGAGKDIGDDGVVAAYDAARSGDVARRVYGVDLLNRSLLAGPAAGLARGAGLHVLHAVPALKRFAMRQGYGAAETAGRQAPPTP